MGTQTSNTPKKDCDQHDFVQGPVNRTEKGAYTVRRNRKCPDCGHYYWTEERTADTINQLNKDQGEEKLALAMQLDKLQQLVEMVAENQRAKLRVMTLLDDAALEL